MRRPSGGRYRRGDIWRRYAQLDAAEPIETTIERLGRCGYDAIEISGEPSVWDTAEVRA